MAKKNNTKRNMNEMTVFAKWRHDENYKPKDPKSKSFAPTTHTMLMNDNYINLKPTTKIIYLYMTDFANGLQETTFPYSIYKHITTIETFKRAKKELIDKGFIEEIKNGRFTRTENVYKFIDKWKTLKQPKKQKRKTKLTTND